MIKAKYIGKKEIKDIEEGLVYKLTMYIGGQQLFVVPWEVNRELHVPYDSMEDFLNNWEVIKKE